MPKALHALLGLERIEHHVFRGRSGGLPGPSGPRVLGGQVAAQALIAAGKTVPGGRHVHSFHACFLHLGDPAVPIVFTVDHLRDGRSFTTRQVVTVQHRRPVLRLAASFHTCEEGLEHQAGMPSVPDPEALPAVAEVVGDAVAAQPRGGACTVVSRYRSILRAASSGCTGSTARSSCGTQAGPEGGRWTAGKVSGGFTGRPVRG